MSEGVRLGRARNAGIQDRQSLLFMNYIHARLFKRSLLVLSVKVGSGFYPAFTLDTEARGLLPFYGLRNYPILSSSQLDTFTVLRQNALTFTLPPPYGGLINVCERLHPLYFRLSIFLTSLLLLLMRKRGWWVSRAGGTATPKTGEF